MQFNKKFSDEGVSPVVGVILMVAITVILSAIIATFVLDLGGTVSQNPSAGVTFDQEEFTPRDSDSVDDADSAADYRVIVQVVSMENADQVTASDTYSSTSDKSMTSVGQTVTLNGPTQDPDGDTNTAEQGLSEGDKVTVTATLEGKTTVIQTYTVKA